MKTVLTWVCAAGLVGVTTLSAQACSFGKSASYMKDHKTVAATTVESEKKSEEAMSTFDPKAPVDFEEKKKIVPEVAE
ncbi:MAG: hypothetical protein AAF468_04960 [Pseudomonadota bacterium]